MREFRYIQEAEERESVTPEELDAYLAEGWRHFGSQFYRYNATMMADQVQFIVPLRSHISALTLTKSQRRVLKKNADTETRIAPATITPEKISMFERHSERFSENQPQSLHDFLSPDPANVPGGCFSLDVYVDDRLIAASYLDVGKTGSSAVYAMFDPEESRRSLGIFTMLKEIEYSQSLGLLYYYLGYGTHGPSAYDYKKQIGALHGFDWEGNWWPVKK